jgi:hypothetical protein
VAGIPVDELTLEGRKMPRGMGVGANEMGKYIAYLAGNERANYMTHKNGRMIDMGQGRYAYAFDRSTGWITPELNGLKYTTADGRTMPLAQFLTQESKPFYDPALNGHDLGRSSQSGGASR